jgi:MYXO-CTERM domain-containing protein
VPAGIDPDGECQPGLCLTTCSGSGACAPTRAGNQCAPNRCTAASKGVGPAACIAQGEACPESEALEFDCGAYICVPAFGACRTNCQNTSDCAAGFVCSEEKCVANAAVSEDDGGCGCATPRARLNWTSAGAVVFLLLAAWRRRRSVFDRGALAG